MTRSRLLLDTSSEKFAFLAKQVEAGTLASGTRASEDKQVITAMPSWVENLWPTPEGRLNAIVKSDLGLPSVPSDSMEDYINSGVRVAVVTVGTLSTYLLVGQVEWQVLSQGVWYDLHTTTAAGSVSVYRLSGKTYMLEPTHKLYEFDPANNPGEEFEGLAEVICTFPGTFTITQMVSSCAALNYRILITEDTVLWSSPTTNTWFDPDDGDDATKVGAGFATIQGVTSSAQFVTGAEDGFYMYTKTEVVKATYTDNPNIPWHFEVVNGSTGVLSADHVFLQNVLTDTFIWSTTGLSALSPSGQQPVAADLTELLAGDIYEEYDTTTKDVEVKSVGVTYAIQLVFAGKRTICVSYGKEGEQRKYILIYDTLTKQWGRIKIDHAAILDIVRISGGGLIFDDWVTAFKDSVESFGSMIDSNNNPQFRTVSLGVLTSTGELVRLSPLDIFTGTVGINDGDYEVLPNVLVYPNLIKTRGSRQNLNEIILNYGYKNYASVVNNDSQESNDLALFAYSDENPTAKQFLSRGMSLKDKQHYTQEVIGNSMTIVVENCNSLNGVEVMMKPEGRSGF